MFLLLLLTAFPAYLSLNLTLLKKKQWHVCVVLTILTFLSSNLSLIKQQQHISPTAYLSGLLLQGIRWTRVALPGPWDLSDPSGPYHLHHHEPHLRLSVPDHQGPREIRIVRFHQLGQEGLSFHLNHLSLSHLQNNNISVLLREQWFDGNHISLIIGI